MVIWYLVGGAVRDLLTGEVPNDFDFSFSGGVDAFIQALPKARKVGRSVDVWLRGNTEFRPLQGESIQEDLLTRDLTINAMAVDEQGRWYGHPSALDDLRNRVLRPASADSFRRDPVRVFRLARLATTLADFSVHDEALALMRQLSGSPALASIPPERVWHEVEKALAAPRPSLFLHVLSQGGCLSPWFAELEGAAHIPAGPPPWHDESVLEHTAEVMDRVAGDPLAVWMALCHDLGKVGTEASLLPRHYGHEERGAQAAEVLGCRLAAPKKFLRAGILAARLHMKGGRFPFLRPGTRRDLLWEVHSARLHQPFWALAAADGHYDPFPLVNPELAAIRAVRLPPEWAALGEASGLHLRELQCQALPSRPAGRGKKEEEGELGLRPKPRKGHDAP